LRKTFSKERSAGQAV